MSANFATATLQVSYDPVRLSSGAVATAIRNCGFQCEAAADDAVHDADQATGAHANHAQAGHGQDATAGRPADAHDGHAGMNHGSDLHAAARDVGRRFLVALAFAIPVFVWPPMGGLMEPPPVPFGLRETVWLFLLATGAVLYPGWPFFSAAIRSLRRGVLDMAVLVLLSVGTGYGFSIASTFFFDGPNFYEASAVLLTFVLLGHWLEMRARVGNPDELRSNKLDHTLDRLKHRVFEPEPGVAESRTGAVITALNEEAVVCAALANKSGLNLVVTYEAFAPKMLGALRQEIIFSRHLAEAGRPSRWLSVPVVLTSHTWENAKNEQSHQDPTLVEALMGEMADVAGAVFPADANSAMATLSCVYAGHGRVVAMVVPKRPVANRLDAAQARTLAQDGMLLLDGDPAVASLLLIATGVYQLAAATHAYARPQEHGVSTALLYISEPGRLRSPRDDREAAHVLDDAVIAILFPPDVPRIFVTHTRPEPYLGVLRRIDTGPAGTRALGFISRGGRLDVPGLMFANRCTWAHIVQTAADILGRDPAEWLGPKEMKAVEGRGNPADLAI